MSNQDQLLTRLAHANPIPDPEDPPTGAVTSKTALHMIMTSIRNEQPTLNRASSRRAWKPPTQRGKAFSVVAVSFILIVVTLSASTWILGRSAEPPVDTTVTIPQTTTTEQVTTTSTSQATTTTTTPEVELFPGIPKLPFGALAPGTVAVEKGVTVPFSFTAPDITADFPLGLWVERRGNPGVGIVPRDAIDPSGIIDYPAPVLIMVMSRAGDPLEAVVADIIDEIPIAAQEDTTIGGRRAVQLETDVIQGGFAIYSFGTQGSGEPIFGLNENQRHRFYVVDAPDGTLVVWLEIVPEAWDTLAPYWEQVADSLQFP